METHADLPPDVFLDVTRKDGEAFRFPITKKTVTIGRDPGCDLHLEDPYVSRKHCQIVFRGDHFTAIDLGSLNKTLVKGTEYIERNLSAGTLLLVGQTQLRFVWDGCLQWRRARETAKALQEGGQPAREPEKPAAG